MSEQIENWEDLRAAYTVARLGTLSGAAAHLGVHHATVMRHVDALEARLGVKLFTRHARGYTPTEAGKDLLAVASATEEQFRELAGRLRGQSAAISGELIITTLSRVDRQITPDLGKFMEEYPDLRVRIITDERLLRLEYGEAHVAIRAGRAGNEPDNVIRPLWTVPMALCATRSYVERHGTLLSQPDLSRHKFVAIGENDRRAPSSIWIEENIPDDRVVLRAADWEGAVAAVQAGIGIGFLVGSDMDHPDIQAVMDPLPEWEVQFWTVTHVDLHRTAKVQAFLKHLREHAPQWARPELP